MYPDWSGDALRQAPGRMIIFGPNPWQPSLIQGCNLGNLQSVKHDLINGTMMLRVWTTSMETNTDADETDEWNSSVVAWNSLLSVGWLLSLAMHIGR